MEGDLSFFLLCPTSPKYFHSHQNSKLYLGMV